MESAKMVFIDKSPQNGLVRMEILEAIREPGKRGLGVYELSEVRGADMFFVLKALKRTDIISARVMLSLGIRSRRWHRG